MLKKLLLSVSLLAGTFLKADSDSMITIQRGDAQVTLTKKEYVNHLDTTFKFLNEHEEESNLLKYFDKFENFSQKNLANFLIVFSSILRVFLPEITKRITNKDLEKVRSRKNDIFIFALYALFLPKEKRNENFLLGLVQILVLPMAISSDINRFIKNDIESINKKRLATIIGTFIPGFVGLVIKHRDLSILQNYLENWSNFATKNSIVISSNELTLYRSCYSIKLNENLILKQIKAYVDKLTIN